MSQNPDLLPIFADSQNPTLVPLFHRIRCAGLSVSVTIFSRAVPQCNRCPHLHVAAARAAHAGQQLSHSLQMESRRS